MCHYARIDFQCGDWRWGNMKVRCPRQHRLGETCGAKLSDMESITRMGDDCRICQHISVKQRRLQRVTDNLIRWRQEGDKFSATIEKARREAADLVTTIHKLHKKRTSFALSRKDEAEKVQISHLLSHAQLTSGENHRDCTLKPTTSRILKGHQTTSTTIQILILCSISISVHLRFRLRRPPTLSTSTASADSGTERDDRDETEIRENEK